AALVSDRLSALEQQHGRDPAHAVAARYVRILVDVELGDGDLVAEVVGNVLERRSDHPARPAPFGPEVDENGAIGAQYVIGKALVGDGLGGHGERNSICENVNGHMGSPLAPLKT